jgi:hypothetical protein
MDVSAFLQQQLQWLSKERDAEKEQYEEWNAGTLRWREKIGTAIRKLTIESSKTGFAAFLFLNSSCQGCVERVM